MPSGLVPPAWARSVTRPRPAGSLRLPAPKLLNNVRTQVRDLDYDTPATLSAAATISRAWRTMQKDKISAIPVANEDGTLFGMLSAGDVANYDMSSVRNPKVGEIPVYNLLSVLEAKFSTRAARCGT